MAPTDFEARFSLKSRAKFQPIGELHSWRKIQILIKYADSFECVSRPVKGVRERATQPVQPITYDFEYLLRNFNFDIRI